MRAARGCRMMPKRCLGCLAMLILCATSVLGGCRTTLPITVRIVTPTGAAMPASTVAPALSDPTINSPTPGSGSAR